MCVDTHYSFSRRSPRVTSAVNRLHHQARPAYQHTGGILAHNTNIAVFQHTDVAVFQRTDIDGVPHSVPTYEALAYLAAPSWRGESVRFTRCSVGADAQ